MKIKKFKNFILTIICAGIFVFCSPVCSDFLNLKNLNIFATETITALAEELEEVKDGQ